jgi:hypothetical protein
MHAHHSNQHLKSGVLVLLIAGSVTSAPSVALANAGTPLMWATALHLLIGNACIGILEGVLLSRLFRIPVGPAIFLMIPANYFSAWIGLVALSTHLLRQFNVTLYNVQYVVWGMIAIAYVATLVIEWPFVLLCFWGTENWLRRSLKASLVVQSISYVLLFGWYGMASVSSLFNELTVVPLDQLAMPSDIRMYYIADEDGDVYSMELGSRERTKVYDLDSRDDSDCLSFDKTSSPTGFHKIVALLKPKDRRQDEVLDIGVTVPDRDCPKSPMGWPLMDARHPGPSQGTALKLGAASDSPWIFKAGYWPLLGLSGENSTTGEHVRFAVEMPYVQWNVRHATQLPSELVLFQLGRRQICVLDFRARKVAVLCFGRGPLARLEK